MKSNHGQINKDFRMTPTHGLWFIRLLATVLAFVLVAAGYQSHQDTLRALGGLLLAFIFYALGRADEFLTAEFVDYESSRDLK